MAHRRRPTASSWFSEAKSKVRLLCSGYMSPTEAAACGRSDIQVTGTGTSE